MLSQHLQRAVHDSREVSKTTAAIAHSLPSRLQSSVNIFTAMISAQAVGVRAWLRWAPVAREAWQGRQCCVRKMSSSVDGAEIGRFDELSRDWWDTKGHFGPLHALNKLRLKYIRGQVTTHFNSPSSSSLSVLDVGCGGGILSEVKIHSTWLYSHLYINAATRETGVQCARNRCI